MTARDVLSMIVATDPRDVGCDAVFAGLDAYVEVVLAGEDPEERLPGITAHLRSCPPCDVDVDGVLDAVLHLGR